MMEPSDAGGPPPAVCASLASQYDAAMGVAQQCSVDWPSQCDRTVPAHVSPCESCLVYVNDPTELVTIEAQWVLAGCDQATGSSCSSVLCPMPTNGACVDTGNGTGKCSFNPEPDNAPDAAAANDCGSLLMRYATALTATQYCTAGAADQCTKTVPSTLNPCLMSCVTYMNDTTVVDSILAEWQSQGCGNIDDTSLCSPFEHSCPATARLTCTLFDNGVATCTPSASP
jgi:hypothetical protein